MAQPLLDLVEQFCIYQRTQRGKTKGGVTTYRWNLGQIALGTTSGHPELRPHDCDTELRWKCTSSITISSKVRALLGHVRIETTQMHARIQPQALKRAVAFYEGPALRGAELGK